MTGEDTTTKVELDDSVASARSSNAREASPEVFSDKPPVDDDKVDGKTGAGKGGDDKVNAAAATKAGEDDAEADKGKGGIPRARLDEVIAQRNALAERLAAKEQADADRAAADEEAKKNPPRDAKAEIAELKAKYKTGAIDEDEFEEALAPLEELREQQMQQRVTETAIKAVVKHEQVREEQTDNQRWTGAQERFFADPVNAKYTDNPIRTAALDQAAKDVWKEREGKITYDDMLKEARDRVSVAFGEKVAAGSESAGEKKERERREAGAKSAAGASALPARPDTGGGVGARGADDDASTVENMSRAEWRKLPQAKRDELLGKTRPNA